jgi:hypothetical protein
MRTMEVPALADILVSELLGSFGDNELSPECLDGAMRFLKREFGHLCLCSWSEHGRILAHSVYILRLHSGVFDAQMLLVARFCRPGAFNLSPDSMTSFSIESS